MLRQLLVGLGLSAACVALHGLYTVSLVSRFRAHMHGPKTSLRTRLLLLPEMMSLLLILHIAEAALWAWAYMADAGMRTFSESLYFSLVTYATVGYGDIAPPEALRLVAGIEGTAGTLLSGWSVALLVALLQVLMHRKQ